MKKPLSSLVKYYHKHFLLDKTTPVFRLLKKEDWEVFRTINTRIGLYFSDHNFTSLFTWDTDDSTFFCMAYGNIVVRMKNYIEEENAAYIYTIIGVNKLRPTLKLIERDSASKGQEVNIRFMPLTRSLKKIKGYKPTLCRDDFDYLLRCEDYLLLKGKDFENKRKKLNRFERIYGQVTRIETSEYDKMPLKKMQALYESWKEFETEGSKYASKEAEAFEKFVHTAWEPEHKKNFIIYLFFVRDNLCGFGICEIVNEKIAIGHFMKANLNISDISEFITISVCRLLYERGLDYYNIEQDLGIPGLRESKLGYRPYKLLEKYALHQHSN